MFLDILLFLNLNIIKNIDIFILFLSFSFLLFRVSSFINLNSFIFELVKKINKNIFNGNGFYNYL